MERYTITADFYIYATSEKDAIKQAKEWEKNMNDLHDNQAKVLTLYETPFASMVARKIEF